MKFKNIDHVVITTKNLSDCIHFYVDILGMEKIESGERIALKFGNAKFNIHTKPKEFLPAAKDPKSGSLDICLIIDGNITDAKNEIESKGGKIAEGPVIRNGATGKMQSIYLFDTDGNLIEIASYKNADGEKPSVL